MIDNKRVTATEVMKSRKDIEDQIVDYFNEQFIRIFTRGSILKELSKEEVETND